MAQKVTPDQRLLLTLLDYDPGTGLLTWKARAADMFGEAERSKEHRAANWNSKNAGREAFGVISPNGYKAGKIGSDRFYAHRLIWKMVHGVEPEHIDHINGVRTDNRLVNLRSVPRVLNNRNMRRSMRASLVPGVRPSLTAGKWVSVISLNNQTKHLGTFKSFDEAVAARKEAERQNGFHPNHGRSHAKPHRLSTPPE